MSNTKPGTQSGQTGVVEERAATDLREHAVVTARSSPPAQGQEMTPTTAVIEMEGLPKRRHLKYRAAGEVGVVKAPQATGGQDAAPVAERAEKAGAAGAATPNFVDNGGPVLSNVHVQLIFWGSAWAGNPTPSANAITNAVASILSGPYMAALNQYRGIGRGALRGTTFVTSSSPPNPFSDSHVANMIANLIENGTVPEPDEDNQILYCVIMPTGVRFSNGGVIGEHSYFTYSDFDFPFDFDNDRAHYAWVINDGTLNGVTSIFSHELVESCTDPEGSAILGTAGTCSQGGWCEIGDVCEGNNGVVDGVTVQSYWSQREGMCVVPNGPRLSNKVILPELAIGAPALSNFNNTRLALAWTGTDALRLLNVANSADGITFGGKVTLNENSIDGPGLACGNGRAFLAWTGTDPGHHLNLLSSTDLHGFGNKVTLNETSPFGPALAFGNGRLFLAWTGTDSNHSLNVMSSTDGIHFTNKVTLGDTSVTAPSLSFIDGKLFLLWCGTDSNHSLNMMESTDGINFTHKVTLGDSSDVHPALAKQAGLLFLAWTGRDAAHHLNALTSRTDYQHFVNKRIDDNTSAAGMTLANFGGNLHIGWTGTDGAHHLNVATLS